jgi:two-component system heavy metal sensor histidine kinase CusS
VKSIGVRLAVWYAVSATLTMVVVFLAGRYFLERYVVNSLDLVNQDEFEQIKARLGSDPRALTPAQIQDRLRESSAYESVLFYVEIHEAGRGLIFSSHNLRGQRIPDVPGERAFNGRIPGFDFEMRIGEFVLGPMDIMVATSKAPVLTVMRGYLRVYLGLVAVMLVISAATGIGLSRLAMRPVRLIQQTASHIGSDNLSERIPVSDVEDEISNLALLLNRMFDRLESSFTQIRRFTAEASHELKTPLSLIRLQAEKLLVEGGLSPAQEESVQVQLEEITRLNQIIEDLLFLSRVEARAITLVLRRQDPARFLHAFAQDARVLAEHRGVTFLEHAEGAGEVEFDGRWIRQVLLNLLANALNVSPPGGVIRLTSELADGVWRVGIEDEGPGVPAELREHIFERFVRLERSAAEPQQGGSGLGLAISRSIIGLHKGRIYAEAAPSGRGLRVAFEIPAPAFPAAAPAAPDPVETGEPLSRASERRQPVPASL